MNSQYVEFPLLEERIKVRCEKNTEVSEERIQRMNNSTEDLNAEIEGICKMLELYIKKVSYYN